MQAKEMCQAESDKNLCGRQDSKMFPNILSLVYTPCIIPKTENLLCFNSVIRYDIWHH